jgi:hypothetical protein
MHDVLFGAETIAVLKLDAAALLQHPHHAMVLSLSSATRGPRWQRKTKLVDVVDPNLASCDLKPCPKNAPEKTQIPASALTKPTASF